MVQILIDARADVNAQGGYYGNALQAASFEGHKKVVQMLMDAGADVNAQDSFILQRPRGSETVRMPLWRP